MYRRFILLLAESLASDIDRVFYHYCVLARCCDRILKCQCESADDIVFYLTCCHPLAVRVYDVNLLVLLTSYGDSVVVAVCTLFLCTLDGSQLTNGRACDRVCHEVVCRIVLEEREVDVLALHIAAILAVGLDILIVDDNLMVDVDIILVGVYQR